MLLLGRVMPQDEPRFFSGSFSFSWSADVIGPRQTVVQKKTFVFYHLKEGAELKKIVLSLVSASDSQIMKRRRQPLNLHSFEFTKHLRFQLYRLRLRSPLSTFYRF